MNLNAHLKRPPRSSLPLLSCLSALTWVFTALAVLAPRIAAAHTCGPDEITLIVGQSATWQISGENEGLTEFSFVDQPNESIAVVTWPGYPEWPFFQPNGVFQITGVSPGATSMTVYWYEQDSSKSGHCSLYIEVLPTPGVPCAFNDPMGDEFGPPGISADLVEATTVANQQEGVDIEVTCAAPVLPPSQSQFATFLVFELDTDQNAATGWEPLQNFMPGLPMVSYGAEVAIYVDWGEFNDPGFGTLLFNDGSPSYLIPVTYSGNSITFDLPSWVLGTSTFDYGVVVGGPFGWTDAFSQTASSSCSGTPSCEGDFNGDSVVDDTDVAVFLATYGLADGDPGYNPACDFTGDDEVGQDDLGLLLQNYNCPDDTPVFGGAPEPVVTQLEIDPLAASDPVSPLTAEESAGFSITFNGLTPANITSAVVNITINDPLNAVTIFRHAEMNRQGWAPPDPALDAMFPALKHSTGVRHDDDCITGFYINALGLTSGETTVWFADADGPDVAIEVEGWFRVEQTAEGGTIIVEPSSGLAGSQQVIGTIWAIVTAAGFGDELFTFSFDIVRVPTSVPGDITGNGVVDVDDLLAAINGWGACPAPPATCEADLTGNGIVNVDDLLEVINNWS